MISFWEIYIVACLSFAIMIHYRIIPKIMDKLASKLSFMEKLVHNVTFFVVAIIFMPILSLVILTDSDNFVNSYIEAWEGNGKD